MRDGYVKMWRRKLDSDLWQNMNANRVFDFILLSATRKVIKHGVGSRVLELHPGDYVSSIRKIAEKCGLTVKETRGALDFLSRTERIRAGAGENEWRFTQDKTRPKRAQSGAQRRAQGFSIFSVANWHVYQQEGITEGTEEGTEKGKARAQQGHSKGTRTRSKEVKKENTYPAADAAGPDLTDREGKGNGEDRQSPKLKVRRKKEYPKDVLELYEDYSDHVVRVPAKKADALRNISACLKEGFTKQQLGDAVATYADECEEKKILEDRRFHPNNFFGMKGYFRGYLPEPEDEREEAQVDD